MARTKMKVGDIFEIPLSDGRKAYGQYVFADKHEGPLIQVFDYFPNPKEEVQLTQLRKAKKLFPPVATGLMAAIKKGMWKIVGHMSINDFQYPGFISTMCDPKTGMATTWYLWDGKEYKRLGNYVPDEYKLLEYSAVWSPYDIVERVETGKNFYESLIKTNKLNLSIKKA